MRRSKYNAKPVKIDGLSFDSKKEARRYGELKLMERAGEISQLTVHPRYSLDVDDEHICDYEADFKYLSHVSPLAKSLGYPEMIVEDVKGMRTAVYRLKKKLMLAILRIEVRET